MDDKAFSSIDFVGQCLTDSERSKAFDTAITSVVKPTHNVLDVGTGSGIMALFAARAGAQKVTAIEFDPYVAEIARNTFRANNFNNIELLIEDARTVTVKDGEKYDVVIMEMLTTGMVDEFQVQAVNNLHKQKAVDESTIFIPSTHETFATLMDVDYTCYGLKMPMVIHLWKWHDWSHMRQDAISNEAVLNTVSFEKPIEEKFDQVIDFKIEKDGIINTIYLSSKSHLLDRLILGNTESLNAPMVVPIAEQKVSKGDIIKVHIKYIFGGGYKNFSAEII